MSKILIVGLNFHPEPIGIGKYTGELAAYLAGQGHQVRVITTPPYYHTGRYNLDIAGGCTIPSYHLRRLLQ